MSSWIAGAMVVGLSALALTMILHNLPFHLRRDRTSLYQSFMACSVLTVNFLILVGYLGYLRFRKYA